MAATPEDAERHAREQTLRLLLAHFRTMQHTWEDVEHELVHLLHQMGMTWESIGEAHDPPISRQAARKRYSHPKPRRRHE